MLRAATLWILTGQGFESLLAPDSRTTANAWFAIPAMIAAVIGGQLADKLERGRLVRLTQTVGLFAAGLAAYGLASDRTGMVLTAVVIAGVQTTLFGPAQGSLVRQHLQDTELTAGNGMLMAVRQFTMLMGIVLIGVAPRFPALDELLIPAILVSAVFGWIAAFGIPASPAPRPDLTIAWSPVEAIQRTLVTAIRDREPFLAILGVSWFWFTSLVFIVNLPEYAREVVGAGDAALTLILLVPVLALMIGSLLCHPASGRRVELGLVPLGAIGMTIAGIDFYMNSPEAAPVDASGLGDLLGSIAYLRCLADLALFGLSAGLFSVPLYALIQQLTDRSRLGRVLGGLHFYAFLFLSLALAGAQWLHGEGLSVQAIVLIAVLMQAGIATYIFFLIPECLLRLIMWALVHIVYKVEATHLERVPPDGPAVIVCNHVAYMDPLVIGAKVRRPVRFVMHRHIFTIPVMKQVFQLAKAIPIVSGRKDPEGLQYALDQVAEELSAGRVVAIFPEGGLTKDGNIAPFKSGIEKIIERNPVPVIPMGLQGFWGSFFSNCEGEPMTHAPRLRRSRIGLHVGEAVPPEKVSADDLHRRVSALRGDKP
jgi:1-acyl-sn-glycerol-3-phosphate acyltransferase